MERKLASIQRIKKIEPIEKADAIEKATILGWDLVVKKGEFSTGDLCIYFEVDSLLPVRPEFEFLRKSCYNQRLDGFRIKTVKLRGQVSQGLALPVKSFPEIFDKSFEEGLDVSEVLGVRKFEQEIPAELSGEANNPFPTFIVPKTDETRIQSVPDVLTRHHGKPCVVTEKLDGTSSTFYFNNGHFGVCGRNWEFKPEVENTYWKIAKKYDLENKLRRVGLNLAIQGEIIGPGIQKNRYKLSDHELRVYSVYHVDSGHHINHVAMENVCSSMGLKTVPVLERNFYINEKIPTIDDAVKYSEGKSVLNPNAIREGVVVKTALHREDEELGRLSFKIINPKYLLKHDG